MSDDEGERMSKEPGPGFEALPALGRPESADWPPASAAPLCEVCGTVMYDRHCKILCPRCGHQRDCSDP
jgi:rubrerythrin